MENEVIKNEVQSEKLEEEACAGKNENGSSKLDEAGVMPLADYIEANSEPVYKSDDNKENERTSSQHNNQPVILEMKKSQKTNRKNKKVSKKKVKDDIIETEDENLIGNIEEGKEDVYFWNAGEDISLKDGERVVAEWGF